MKAENDAIREENTRQNRRIDKVETDIEKLTGLTISVERMAVSMKSMTDELKTQGKRLEAIESRPSKRWDTIVSGILGAVAGAIGAGIVAALAGVL